MPDSGYQDPFKRRISGGERLKRLKLPRNWRSSDSEFRILGMRVASGGSRKRLELLVVLAFVLLLWSLGIDQITGTAMDNLQEAEEKLGRSGGMIE